MLPDPATGRPVRRYLSGKTERELLAKLRAARADADAGRSTGRTPTLATWTRRWLLLTRSTVRTSTVDGYRANLERHVLPKLGDVELAKLRPSDVEALTTQLLASGLAASTVVLVRTTLVICLNAAVRDGVLDRNPASSARAPRVPRTEKRALSPAELRQLLAVAAADDEVGPAVELLATTGLRRGELLGLTWGDVSASSLTVRRAYVRTAAQAVGLAEPKSSRSARTILLPARAAAALARRRELAGDPLPSDPVFPGRFGADPMHPDGFGNAFRRLADRAQLHDVTAHTLRHTVASQLLAAGVPVRDVAEALGHSPAVLLRTYAHAQPGSRERVAAALDGVLDG